MKRVSVDFYRLYRAFDTLPSATLWFGQWGQWDGDDGLAIMDLDMSWLKWNVTIEWRRYKKRRWIGDGSII